MAHQHLNGGPPIQAGQGNMGAVSSSSSSSFSVLSNQTGGQSNNGFMVTQQSNVQASMTDVTLEQAMGKVQDLANENSTLRGIHLIIFYNC